MELKYVMDTEVIADYDKRESAMERAEEKGLESCYICGKALTGHDFEAFKRGEGNYIQVFDGGDKFTLSEKDVELDHDDAGYMGNWPVGSTCYKKFLKLLHV